MSVLVEGDFIVLGGYHTGPWLSWDGGKTWEIWRDFPFRNIQSMTRLKDGRLACTTFGSGVFLVDGPYKGDLKPSSGTINITNTSGTSKTLNVTFTLKDNAGHSRVINSSIITFPASA